MLFDKKEMKLISDYRKVQKYLMDGTPVYLVQMDGTLLELMEATRDIFVTYFITVPHPDRASRARPMRIPERYRQKH